MLTSRTSLRDDSEHRVYRAPRHRRSIRVALLRNMDLVTLLSWRCCCRRNYFEVAEELRGYLRVLLADFVPSPSSLLSLITRTKALISGIFAIRYLLRDDALIVPCLDIYVGSVSFLSFIDEFGGNSALSGYQQSWIIITHRDPYAYSRQITQTLEIRLSTGKMISIHASATAFACHPIARSPSSVGTTFITEYCVATAYPRLTLNHRGIICLSALVESRGAELDMYETLEAHGFTFQEDPTNWPEFTSDVRGVEAVGCLRSVYLCPQQCRYFGDGGSMVAFFDQFSMALSDLKARQLPPYGIMSAWRLPSGVRCDDGCDEVDGILGPDLLTISVTFEDDLFSVRSPSAIVDPTIDDVRYNILTQLRRRTITM